MLYVKLAGSMKGSRWREHGVITYLDMTKYHCYIDTPYKIPTWLKLFTKPVEADWTLFVITPRDTEALTFLTISPQTIFVAHDFDFVDDVIPDNPKSNNLLFFTPKQKLILNAVGKQVRRAGGKYFPDIKTAVGFLKAQVED